ncbi:hypothetical protein HKD37_05G013659 [Glycine soja]
MTGFLGAGHRHDTPQHLYRVTDYYALQAILSWNLGIKHFPLFRDHGSTHNGHIYQSRSKLCNRKNS